MANRIHVDMTGLSVLASSCAEQAATVRATATPATDGAGFAATSAAIAAVHGDLSAAADLVAWRLDSIADATATASAGYDETEGSSAQAIAAVGSQAPTIHV